MNEYGMSPWQVLQVVGPMMFVVPMLLWLVVIGPLVIYPIVRWKLHREQSTDNQLGLKVALHYFRMMGFQLLLLGAVMLIYAVIGKGSDKGDIYRAAFGFIVPSGIVLGAGSARGDDVEPKLEVSHVSATLAGPNAANATIRARFELEVTAPAGSPRPASTRTPSAPRPARCRRCRGTG